MTPDEASYIRRLTVENIRQMVIRHSVVHGSGPVPIETIMSWLEAAKGEKK